MLCTRPFSDEVAPASRICAPPLAHRRRSGLTGGRKEPPIAAKPDRRPERSRQALLAAFVELVLEGGYASLTADQVAARANVARSTLYAHFGGLEGLLREALAGPSAGLAVLVDTPPDGEASTWWMRHFWSQRRRNRVFFAPPVRDIWVGRLAELIEPRLRALIAAERRPEPILPVAFVATQVAQAQIALIIHWLQAPAGVSPEAAAQALAAATRGLVDALAPPRRD